MNSSTEPGTEIQVIDTEQVKEHTLPGLSHRTVAGRHTSLENLEVWYQMVEPEAGTPVHYHECEEVLQILEGTGVMKIESTGEAISFDAPTTLVVPAEEVHQILNTGVDSMRLVASLSETPARVFSPEGEIMELPWLEQNR